MGWTNLGALIPLVIACIPLILLIKNWSQSSIAKKLVIILPIIVVLYFSYGFVIYLTPIHEPIRVPLDLQKIEVNKTYTYSAYTFLPSYLVGLETNSEKDCSSWSNASNIEISFSQGSLTKTIIGQQYVAYNCMEYRGSSQYDFGELVDIPNFQRNSFSVTFKSLPPAYIKSMSFIVADTGDNEFFGEAAPIIYILDFIVVYLPLLIYWFITYMYSKYAKRKNKTHGRTRR